MLLATALFLFPAAVPRASAFDDYGTWQWTSLEVFHAGKFSANLFNELRWRENSTDFSLGLVGPLFRWQGWTHTSFALGGYYLHVPRGFNLDDTNQAWLDVEMLNTWKASDDISVSMRTMFENRWLEDPHGNRQVSRHRFGLATACHKLGPVSKIYCNDELFLDWDTGKFRENRAIPVAASFKLNDHACLDVFPMIRSTEGAGTWTHEFILGTHFVWKL